MVNIRQFIGDAKFPCSKQELLKVARSHNAPTDVIRAIEGMREKNYNDLTDVTREVSL
jgi:hypothetical protein